MPIDSAHAALLIVDVQNYCAHPDSAGSHSSMPNIAESVRNGRLAPAEEALDVGEVERHIGRAAVIALAAVGGGLHLA